MHVALSPGFRVGDPLSAPNMGMGTGIGTSGRQASLSRASYHAMSNSTCTFSPSVLAQRDPFPSARGRELIALIRLYSGISERGITARGHESSTANSGKNVEAHALRCRVDGWERKQGSVAMN